MILKISSDTSFSIFSIGYQKISFSQKALIVLKVLRWHWPC